MQIKMEFWIKMNKNNYMSDNLMKFERNEKEYKTCAIPSQQYV